MPSGEYKRAPHYRYVEAGVQPWDKRDDETQASFIAFAFYRDMGPSRSLRAAWFAINPDAKNMNPTFFKWSAMYGWKDRAIAFDRWRNEIETKKIKEWEASKGQELERNRNQQRQNETTLGYKAMQKADEILSLPLIRHSFTSQQNGVLQVHKTFLQSPGYLLAAATLMKHGSDMARRGLGISDEESGSLTPDSLKKLLYRTSERLAADMPPGALPVPLDNAAVEAVADNPKPDADPDDAEAGKASESAARGVANPTPAAPAAPPVTPAATPVEVHRFRPPRARP